MEKLSESVEETIALGRSLGEKLRGGEIILLTGQLAAGKTHFVKGIAEALGVDGVVTSPTFSLHNCYKGTFLTLNHFDFYRICDPSEAENLGLTEFFGAKNSVCAVEWWQNVEIFGGKQIEVKFQYVSDNVRKISYDEKLLTD